MKMIEHDTQNMSKSEAQIAIRPETRERLFEQKNGPNDTYDQVVNRLLDKSS